MFRGQCQRQSSNRPLYRALLCAVGYQNRAYKRLDTLIGILVKTAQSSNQICNIEH